MKYLHIGAAIFAIIAVALILFIFNPACDPESKPGAYATARIAAAGLQGAYPALSGQFAAGCQSGAIAPDSCEDFYDMYDPTIRDALTMIIPIINAVERIDNRTGADTDKVIILEKYPPLPDPVLDSPDLPE